MNATLSKALVALVPAGILFVGSVLLFLSRLRKNAMQLPQRLKPS